ncbi:MAG: phage holin family protein [Proteobacteria bacterium]|nr:phage holin family protein [Pseudomonadota bacterium]
MESMDDTIAMVHGAIGDINKLMNLHVELVKAESKKISFTIRRVFAIGILLVISIIPTSVVFLIALADWLHVSTTLTVWQAQLLVAAVCLAACFILAYQARSKLLNLWEDNDNG